LIGLISGHIYDIINGIVVAEQEVGIPISISKIPPKEENDLFGFSASKQTEYIRNLRVDILEAISKARHISWRTNSGIFLGGSTVVETDFHYYSYGNQNGCLIDSEFHCGTATHENYLNPLKERAPSAFISCASDQLYKPKLRGCEK